LAEKIRQRDPGSAPAIGDRVPYVIVKGSKKDKVFMKSENPLYALENSIPLDTKYYLENQISKPLLRLFEHVIPDTSVLLSGDHMRHIFLATPSEKIGIVRFTVKMNKCIECKAVIPASAKDQGLCAHCSTIRPKVYLKRIKDVRDSEVKFGKLWTQCQRCQGSLHEEVICAANDCPIFYARRKVQKDLTDAQQIVARLTSLEF
jgi:DNA polymerase delta subunit 1